MSPPGYDTTAANACKPATSRSGIRDNETARSAFAFWRGQIRIQWSITKPETVLHGGRRFMQFRCNISFLLALSALTSFSQARDYGRSMVITQQGMAATSQT